MKNQFLSRSLALMLMLALTLGFDSCKKSDDNPVVTPTTTIEGNYKITALKIDPKALGLYDDLLAASQLVFNSTCLKDLTISFKTGGTATTDNPSTCQAIPVPVSTFTGIDASSKWAQSGSTLTITKSDGTKTDYTVLSTSPSLQLQWKGAFNYPTPSTTTYTYTMTLAKQ
jgi:hypothetical protein